MKTLVFAQFASLVLFAAISSSPAHAQGVFKCSAGGKTIYQSAPCEGQGKEIAIAPPPTEQQARDAKQRADADKGRAAAPSAATAPPPRELATQKYDCAALNQQRAEAFGRRNGAIRESRATNVDKSATVMQDTDRIRFIEGQMVKGGCKPT